MKKHLVATILMFLLITGCSTHPGEGCSAADLLLNETNFPERAIDNGITSPMPDAPMDSAGWTLSVDDDFIHNHIYRYSTQRNARKRFERDLKIAFPEDDYSGEWQEVTKSSSLPLFPDQYFYACGKELNDKTCKFIAQYGIYYVFLSSEVSESGITQQQFEELILEMDQKMGTCSDNSKESPN